MVTPVPVLFWVTDLGPIYEPFSVDIQGTDSAHVSTVGRAKTYLLAKVSSGVTVTVTDLESHPEIVDPKWWGTDVSTSTNPVKVKSQTIAPTPSNRTRTTIGIGEKVTCWTDPSVSVTWSVTPTGDGSVYPPQGTSTILTASRSPSTPTVHAKIGTADCTLAFTVIAPSSTSYLKDQDNPPWTPWSSGDKYLGARTTYDVTVNPTTVSFYNAEFQENFGSGETDIWPDGSTWYGPSGPVSFTVNYANNTTDTQSTGLYNSNKLYTGSQWQGFSPDFDLPDQYKNESATWVTYHTDTAARDYYQSDRTTRVRVGGQNGGLQGPWQQ